MMVVVVIYQDVQILVCSIMTLYVIMMVVVYHLFMVVLILLYNYYWANIDDGSCQYCDLSFSLMLIKIHHHLLVMVGYL